MLKEPFEDKLYFNQFHFSFATGTGKITDLSETLLFSQMRHYSTVFPHLLLKMWDQPVHWHPAFSISKKKEHELTHLNLNSPQDSIENPTANQVLQPVVTEL